LDDKGRLVLPAPFRREFEDAGGGVLAPWDRCLALWTREKFGNVMEQLIDRLREGDANDDVVRLFQSHASEVQFDTQGRFVVPEDHRDYAGITREVKVLGQTNRVEFWDLANFTAMEDATSREAVSGEIRRLRLF